MRVCRMGSIPDDKLDTVLEWLRGCLINQADLLEMRRPDLLPVSRTPCLGAIVKLEVAYDEAEFQSGVQGLGGAAGARAGRINCAGGA